MRTTPIRDAVRAYALEQVGKPYIMGATAVKCTPKYRKARAVQYPDYADNIYANCPVLSDKQSSCESCQWEGQIAHDCAQLTKFAAKAGGISLPSGATNQWQDVDWFIKGEIADMPMDVVCFVYHLKKGTTDRMSHTGVYLGDGTVSDARGHDYKQGGVLHKDVASYPWTHYAIPYEIAKEVGLDMSERPTYADERRPTLRKGSKGDAVREAQQLLNAWDDGPQLVEDGIYGTATKAAVEAFQLAHGLADDGILGPKTWAVLLKIEVVEGEEGAEDGPADTPETSVWDTLTLEEKVEDLNKRLKRQEGGNPDG